MARGEHVHYTYDDVLEALRVVEPASTMRVFGQLEGRSRVSGAAKKRRDWMWGALMNMAASENGPVEYVIEPRPGGGRAYIWSTRRR